MKIQDCKIHRIGINKYREVMVTVKVKSDDLTPDGEEALRRWWEDGESFDLDFLSPQNGQ